MSTYEWEAGTIKLSTKEFPKVRKAILDAANAHRAESFARATAIWTGLKAGAARDSFTHERDEELLDRLFRETKTETDAHGRPVTRYIVRTTPLMPRKKDYAPYPAKTLAFHASWAEAAVKFDPKARTVRWTVSENNHAVERARGSWLGRAFFTALGRVTWTRGTGGDIVGNDEYNRDSDYEGGGGNYVTTHYPPPPAPRYGGVSAFSRSSSPTYDYYRRGR